MERKPDEPIFTGVEGAVINLAEAAEWTKNYRHKHPKETISQLFGRDLLEQLLAQPGSIGIRFYYAHDKPLSGWQRFIVAVSNFILNVFGSIQGEKRLVIVGVTSDGSDQLPPTGVATANVSTSEPVVNLAAAPSPAATPGPTGSLSTTAPPQPVLRPMAFAAEVGDQSVPCPGRPGCPNNVLTS